jgi:hypothetical protein
MTILDLLATDTYWYIDPRGNYHAVQAIDAQSAGIYARLRLPPGATPTARPTRCGAWTGHNAIPAFERYRLGGVL